MGRLYTKPENKIDVSAWREYKRTGDLQLRNQIILHYSYIVKYAVINMRNMFKNIAEQEDLINEGIVALMDAIERYNPDKEVKFETYASIRVRGAVIDFIRRQDWVPRRVRKNAKDTETAVANLWAEYNRQPTDEEVAGYLGITVDELRTNMAQSYSASVVSFEELIQDNLAGLDTFVSPESGSAEDMPEEALSSKEFKDVIAQTIDKLPPKEKLVVAMYYYENLKLKEIAQVLEVSESRVCQLHTSAIAKLRRSIEVYVKE